MSQPLSIDICVCTFRRAHLLKTLASLAGLETNPEWVIRVLVADNDDIASAKKNVENISQNFPFELVYIHAPARNICIARNACLDNATADFVAFLDDDETASSTWLTSLINTQQSQHAQAVLGPVDAIYSDDAPSWIKKGNFHSTRPVWVNGEIITGYTCNLLLDRKSLLVSAMRFLPELGTTGGEDTVYLNSLYQNGGKIAYAETALLTEPVPTNRASFLWLIKRRFRSGQTHALLILRNHGDNLKTKLIQIVKAAGKASICFTAAIPFVVIPSRAAEWILRGTLHIGVIARLFGQKELTLYG